jgi:hypothetical protein
LKGRTSSIILAVVGEMVTIIQGLLSMLGSGLMIIGGILGLLAHFI